MILMCGRFTLKTSPARIKEMFRLQRLGEFDPRYNIAPSQLVLAVRAIPKSEERQGVFLKWGLIPSWATEPGPGDGGPVNLFVSA
jgi:putative SOS response-associated peptidase YedK